MSTQPLINSRRRFEKRTYTPLILDPAGTEDTTNALGLAAQIRALMVSDSEFTQLEQRTSDQGRRDVLTTMRSLTTAVSASEVLSAASSLAAGRTSDLRAIGQDLGAIRSESLNTLVGGLHSLNQKYAAAIAAPAAAKSTADASAAAPSGTPVTAHTVPAAYAERRDYKVSDGAPVQSRLAALHLPAAAQRSPGAAQVALASTVQAQNATVVGDRLLRDFVGPQFVMQIPAVTSWAVANADAQVHSLLNLAQPYAGTALDTPAVLGGAISNLLRLSLLTKLFDQSLTERPLQPVGLLHLERLEMTPLDVERGELSYSLPLAPNEKVTLAHREWSVREEQFSEFIEDYQENFSEQGVAQTDDMAMATSTQTSHNDALSVSQPIAPSNGVHLTSPVDTTKAASSSVDDTTTREESKAQSRTVTALASTRTMKDHKVSFTVTTVSGMEDFTAHLIENKNHDKSMRIDYFKRIRKWQSDLYRYGVRLTYDVVLPDPGAELRQRVVELQSIASQLSTEFRLDLDPSQIQVSNWEQLAGQYGVVLPSPPEQVLQIETAQQISYGTPFDINTAGDGSKWQVNHRLVTMGVGVPGGYRLDNLDVFAHVQAWPDEPNPNGGTYQGWVNAYAGQSVVLATRDVNLYCDIDWNLGSNQVPAEGQITVIFRMQLPESGLLKLTATVVPTESTMEAWRLACWATIRDAASAAAAQHRSYLRDRQAALQKQIAGDDTVRLRRMEREAIMRAVLEWLFPGFEDASSVLSGLPSPGSLDPGSWQQVMQYGEYIKFVQTAIDWDNITVFLYPYFWDTIWHEPEKLFLDHPDAIHREFLRAGAARVIIAIQPGFEDQVVGLLDQGQLGNLGGDTRFSKVIQDVHDANDAYAKTTQGGGAHEDPQQPGVLIGSWTDYTPTSALDIEVTVQTVISA